MEVSDEFLEDCRKLYPIRGGVKGLCEKYGVDGRFVWRVANYYGIIPERTNRLSFYRESIKSGYFEEMVRQLLPQSGGIKRLLRYLRYQIL